MGKTNILSRSKFLLFTLMFTLTLFCSVSAYADKDLPPVASITIDDKQISFIVGYCGFGNLVKYRRDGRADEGAGLENQWALLGSRGFESHSLLINYGMRSMS